MEPSNDVRRIRLAGRLDATTVPHLWEQTLGAHGADGSRPLLVDAHAVEYCDGSGLALLIELGRRQRSAGAAFELDGLATEFARQLPAATRLAETGTPPAPRRSRIEQIGKAAARTAADLKHLVSFVGELTLALLAAFRRPAKIRFKDAALAFEASGVDAVGIVGVVSFLMGLILAFQSAVPMKMFGAEIFVADLVALSMLRELGPLMTAIVLTGRTGSAFAAELGTMKVNEEIDALTTMGVDPVRFLVVPRVLAAVVATPLLAVFANFMGLVGGALVFLSLGFPLVTYIDEVLGILGMADLLTGLLKAFVFGVIVAAVGCLRGLQTGSGASAVGHSTTRAVVSGIFLIVLTDGAFSVIFYALDL